MKSRTVAQSTLILTGCCASICVPAMAQADLPDGPGRAAFEKVCSTCHGLDRATAVKLTPAEWKEKLDAMVQFGASGTAEELAAINEYLAKNFGAPSADQSPAPAQLPAQLLAQPPVQPLASAPTKTLPEGKGKELIGKMCVGCHKPENFTAYQHTPEEWAAILVRMGERVRVPNTKADLDEIAGYLASNFPKVDDPNRVNVNKVPAEEIAARLGFTPDEAQKIVEYRLNHAPFASWGDLLIIYGVDGKKVKAARDRLSF